MLAYGGVETAGLPYFLTPVRRKDKTDIMDRSPDGCLAEVTKTNGLLSVSPVLRQLGLWLDPVLIIVHDVCDGVHSTNFINNFNNKIYQ